MAPHSKYQRYGVGDATKPHHPTTVIANVRVFDGYGFSEARSVTIEKGQIVKTPQSVGQKIEHVDGRGRYLLPGLTDSHCHAVEVRHLEEMRSAGITTAMELGNNKPSEIAAMKHLIGLPDLYIAGIPATSPDGGHVKSLNLSVEDCLTTPTDAVLFVSKRIKTGSDHIKIIADTPGIDQPTMNMLVNQAKQNDLLPLTHAANHKAWLMALRSRTAMIHHVPIDKSITDEDLQGHHDFVAVPTLTCLKTYMHAPLNLPPEQYGLLQESVRTLRNAGIPILVGSDSVESKTFSLKIPFGTTVHKEMELLVEAGLSCEEAIRGATVLPPKYFGLKDRGVIAPGMRADLVMLSSNPLEDIKAMRQVEHVWLKGVEYKPGAV